MDDSLARARRALRETAPELTVTWADVLARSEAGETAPVVPPRTVRQGRGGVVRLAVAAVLVVAVAVGGAVVGRALRSQPPAPLEPAGPAAVASATPSIAATTTAPDEARLILDRVRQSLVDTTWCGVSLAGGATSPVLYLDAALSPVALLGADLRRGRTPDGQLVSVDNRRRTWQPLSSADDMTADQPALAAAAQALRQVSAGEGPWQRKLGGAGPVLYTVDGDEAVVVAVDPKTVLPATVSTTAGDLVVDWLPCDGSVEKAAMVAVPEGYVLVGH